MTWDEAGQTLRIQAPDGAGLLMAIAKALHESCVTIVASEIQTEGSTANDRFELRTRDGDELDEAARDEVVVRVRQSVLGWQQRAAILSAS